MGFGVWDAVYLTVKGLAAVGGDVVALLRVVEEPEQLLAAQRDLDALAAIVLEACPQLEASLQRARTRTWS